MKWVTKAVTICRPVWVWRRNLLPRAWQYIKLIWGIRFLLSENHENIDFFCSGDLSSSTKRQNLFACIYSLWTWLTNVIVLMKSESGFFLSSYQQKRIIKLVNSFMSILLLCLLHLAGKSFLLSLMQTVFLVLKKPSSGQWQTKCHTCLSHLMWRISSVSPPKVI